MPNYQQGKIYAIRSHQTDKVYIGSTTQPLHQRMGGHRADYKFWKKAKKNYVSSYEIIEYEDSYIELIENFPCKDKNELSKKEGEVIRATNCVNKVNPQRRTPEMIKQYMEEYRVNNIDKLKEREKNWRENNKTRKRNTGKNYYEKNKERLLTQCKEYREEHKQRIKERLGKILTCKCGLTYTQANKLRHEKSKKHNDYLISPLGLNELGL